jgi:hypothetical protein
MVFQVRGWVWRLKCWYVIKVKVKLPLCFNWAPRHKGIVGEWRYSSTHSLASALEGGELYTLQMTSHLQRFLCLDPSEDSIQATRSGGLALWRQWWTTGLWSGELLQQLNVYHLCFDVPKNGSLFQIFVKIYRIFCADKFPVCNKCTQSASPSVQKLAMEREGSWILKFLQIKSSEVQTLYDCGFSLVSSSV